MDEIITKKCTKCGERKSFQEFSVNGYCKMCNNKLAREWRATHPEKELESKRKWRRTNPEKVKAQAYKNYRKNKNKILEYIAGWRAKNSERVLEVARKWRKENPDKIREKSRNRRARIDGNGGKITKEEWNTLKKFYDYTCLCCGKKEPEIKLTLDHVLPIAKGGKHIIENAQPLCNSCNCKKNVRHIDYR